MLKSDKQNIVAIIPARYASSRFPGKPLAKISGKTLIQRTYENAQRCSSLDLVVVATDDKRIFDHVMSFGGEVVMTSSSCPTGTDRLVEVVSLLSLAKDTIIINVQGDEPCLESQVITQVAEILLNDSTAVMSTAAVPLTSEEEAKSSSIVKCVMDIHQNALYFSRSLIPGNKTNTFISTQSYYRHIGIYAYRCGFLKLYPTLSATPLQLHEDLEQLKVLEHGYKIKTVVVNSTSIGVDTPEDIKKVEHLLWKQNSSLSQAESAPH